jgi:hypothetical protein
MDGLRAERIYCFPRAYLSLRCVRTDTYALSAASHFRSAAAFALPSLVLLIVSIYLVISPDNFIAELLEIYPLPRDFRLVLLLIAVLNGAVSLLYEQFVIIFLLGKKGLGRRLASIPFYRRLLGEEDYKEYAEYSTI